ncbi:MAG: cyclase family protein [Proteobacteria bacterium]|nr:cyclase family protein [Pseudomonadota bacterium]MBU1709849.1 cyclase family protein [Pseudomonadota bacterium]
MSRRIVDLTLAISESMPTFSAPWHPVVEIRQLGHHGIENRETRRLVIGTHTGTHVDAPLHFIENGKTIDQIPLDILVGPANIIDLTWADDSHEVSKDELFEAIAGRDVTRLILKYGWDSKIGSDSYFKDHAFLSESACHYLVSEGCLLLGMDTAQPDNPLNCKGSENDAPNHKILLENGVILVEYLVNLELLRKTAVELVVAPLKISGGDGAPARCFAIENYDD